MNIEIKHLYDGLDEVQKNNIRASFEQSPKMLLYIELLEQDVVNTNKAINYIYQEDLETVPRNVLVNRFYKLRSKLRLWLLGQMRNNPICLTSEEQELAFLRLMVIKNEHAYALEQLQILEQKCWEQNLFELLPEIIFLIIRSLHACEDGNKVTPKTYLDKLELANSLLGILQSMKYNLCFLKYNIKDYPTVVEGCRRKIKKLKKYPRFEMLYHYLAFSAGVFLEDIVQKTSNAMSRHLNDFNKLKSKYPAIPVDEYEPYHREKMEIVFCTKEAIFWYYKQDPKRSFAAIQRRKKLLEVATDLYPKLSEAELHNIIYFCINAEQYHEALEYIEQLKEYQANNPYDKIDNPYYIYNLIIYVGLFPTQKCPNPEELIQQIKAFVEISTRDTAWIYGSLSEFCILYGFFEEAKSFLKHPSLKFLYENNGIEIQTDKLLQIIEKQDVKGLNNFIDFINELHQNSTSSKHQFHYKGILKIAQYFAKWFSKNKGKYFV